MPPAEDRLDEEVQPAEEAPKLVVDVSEPDDDDEGDKAAASPELDRRGRRAHYRELKKAHESLQERYEALERRVNEGQRQAPQQETARPGEPAELAPIRARLAELESIEDALMERAGSAQLTVEQQKDLNRRYRAVKREEGALIARGVAINERARQPQQDGNADTIGALLRSEFPEVYASQGLSGLAQWHFEKLVQAGKNPADIETSREALRRTRQQAGIGQRPPAPTNGDRARLASVPARAGAAGSPSGGWAPSKMHIRTAVAWAREKGMDVDESEAVKRWYHKVGKPNGLV